MYVNCISTLYSTAFFKNLDPPLHTYIVITDGTFYRCYSRKTSLNIAVFEQARLVFGASASLHILFPSQPKLQKYCSSAFKIMNFTGWRKHYRIITTTMIIMIMTHITL